MFCIYVISVFSFFCNIICTICIKPKIPKIGYKILTKFENPIPENITALAHIKKAILLYPFLFTVTFFKKPIPKEIAVVKIEIKIIIP